MGLKINGVQVFSATKGADRDKLGDAVTEWLQDRSHIDVVDIRITQSSDNEFHCLAITVLYFDPDPVKTAKAPAAQKFGTGHAQPNGGHGGNHPPRHHGRT